MKQWNLLACIVCVIMMMANPIRTSAQSQMSRAVHFRGRVLDHSTGEPINGARIKLGLSSLDPVWRTDARGHFSFWTSSEGVQRIDVEREGYVEKSLEVNHMEVHDIRLTPRAELLDTNRLTAPNAAAQLLPPSQAVAPAILTADSEQKPSGTGRNWSRWYQLGVGKAPGGYTLHRDEFWLSGDRTCGSSAECREVTSNDRKVLWEFRLQGHTEVGAPAITYSVAHIRVVYRSK